ncbi:WXG100 family type VII secretion target [Antrihabitans cavernicola]|uniref:WXG100 family type VII secretion target n=1 Tax=Antrihabitans cavernicola TaxID=2495913 RepID=A0A5A7S5P0_9NOCA|nr:WXG100 family type VII secretion target [Spelaeibacter cavernicola]KAA0021488.1 WXG100 family type VII secretion target [Spelaeibacter cavernicola]
MSKVVSDVAAMQASATHVDLIHDELSKVMQAIDSEVHAADWKGSAAIAMVALNARYTDAMAKLNQSLSEIAQNIRANGKGYSDAEQSNEDLVKQLQGAIPSGVPSLGINS